MQNALHERYIIIYRYSFFESLSIYVPTKHALNLQNENLRALDFIILLHTVA